MLRTSLVALGLVTAAGCARNWNACNETRACQAQADQRDRLFGQAVAEARLHMAAPAAITRVASNVLVDRDRGLVYAGTTQGLVAFELKTGARRWERPDVRAAELEVAGPWLVAAHFEADPRHRVPATLSVLAWPASSTTVPAARSCRLPLGEVLGLNNGALRAFEYDGQLHLLWHTWVSWNGGTPPGEGWAAEREAANHCGLMEFEPTSCSASPLRRQTFMWPLSATISLKPPALCDSSEYDMPVLFVAPTPTEAALGPRVFIERPANACATADQLVVQQDGVERWRASLQVRASSACVP